MIWHRYAPFGTLRKHPYGNWKCFSSLSNNGKWSTIRGQFGNEMVTTIPINGTILFACFTLLSRRIVNEVTSELFITMPNGDEIVVRFRWLECKDSWRAKDANGNNFTVGFLEVNTRDELGTGYTTPRRNNALAMLFINFRVRGISHKKLHSSLRTEMVCNMRERDRNTYLYFTQVYMS